MAFEQISELEVEAVQVPGRRTWEEKLSERTANAEALRCKSAWDAWNPPGDGMTRARGARGTGVVVTVREPGPMVLTRRSALSQHDREPWEGFGQGRY